MHDSAKLRVINQSQRREIAALREQLEVINDLIRRVRILERAVEKMLVRRVR